MASVNGLTQEALDLLDAGVCICSFTHPKYMVLMFWFTEPRHPGQVPPFEED